MKRMKMNCKKIQELQADTKSGVPPLLSISEIGKRRVRVYYRLSLNHLLKSSLNQLHQEIRGAFMSQHTAVDTDIIAL